MGTWLLDDLSDYLTTQGVTTTIYKSFMPETPDESIVLVETGGLPAVHAMSGAAGAAVEERPSVQIMRRSPVFQRARAEMNYIWRLLDGAGDLTINGTAYKWIEAMQSPFPLPRDASNRSLVACNFRVFKAPSTSTST